MSLCSPTSGRRVPTDCPRALRCPGWAPPLLAVQFLTRLPVPGLAALSAEQVAVGLGRAVAWFPLVGTLIGVVTAAVFAGAGAIWPRAIAVVIALIVEARLTGAFHEDAVADFCDGFGGGRDAGHVRDIMKDSRIGTYGALGLLLAVGLRAAAIVGLDPVIATAAIVASATFGRLLVVVTMAVIPPAAAGTGLAKDIGAAIGGRDVAVAVLLALPGLAWFAVERPLALVAATAAAALFLIWFRALLLRRIGGSTGDCLGFAAYAGQLMLLLASAA
ncbi:adenosylcobinamide-GDP ribazoletransferase [Polymorphobacter megasporae]|nr:adenosylcobinamide-GDP ribazoletransferase [Polymorphobacter megasporae]